MTNLEITNAYVGNTQVAKIYLGADVVWPNESPEPAYDEQYLTIEALSGGTFYIKSANIGYSVNEGAWETTTGATTLVMNQGDTVRFKSTAGGNSLFTGNTLAFNVYGNVESLEYGDDFVDKTEIRTASLYYSMFLGSSGLKSAEYLVLPATTLATECYRSMFYNCSNLTTAPELPAISLAGGCYREMFYNCSNLTAAPELPATTLQSYCYTSMFRGCTSLTSAPVLPATTLESWCYRNIFANCTSLNTITCLATDISAVNCLTNWVNGVASTGTFVKAASMTGWPSGINGIPAGWTIKNANV